MIVYTKTIDDETQKILENDLLDIKNWIDGMIDGKIRSVLKRLANDERERLISEGATTVPAKSTDLALSAFSRPDYKNRVEREASAFIKGA